MSSQMMATPLWFSKMIARWVVLGIVTTLSMGYAGANREFKMAE
jgi:hypothetical protein